jgi:hypothetical protein
MGIMLTPWGCLGLSRGRWADTATAQGVANPADLLLEGRGAAAQAAEPPQSPVFCEAKNAPLFLKILGYMENAWLFIAPAGHGFLFLLY